MSGHISGGRVYRVYVGMRGKERQSSEEWGISISTPGLKKEH